MDELEKALTKNKGEKLERSVEMGTGERGLFGFRGGKLVPIRERKTVRLAKNNFISDDMDPTFHHADCKYYTSKSKFRETTRRHGFVECHGVGDEYFTNDHQDSPEYARELEEDVEKAYNALKYNEAPITEEERKICQEMDQEIADQMKQ